MFSFLASMRMMTGGVTETFCGLRLSRKSTYPDNPACGSAENPAPE